MSDTSTTGPDAGEADQLHGGRLARRTVITGALTAAGGLVLAGAAGAGVPRQGSGSGYLDVSDPGALASPGRIRLKIDNRSAEARAEAEAVPLPLGTSRNEAVPVTVTSTTGRTTLRAGPTDPGGAGTVSVRPSQGSQAVVWVTPREVGPPLAPGDQLVVQTPDGEARIDVWIEPEGGQWDPLDPVNEVDLGICAINAALMRKGSGTEVVMYSVPRVRNPDGTPMRNPKWNPNRPNDTNKWAWNARVMEDLESRALDINTLRVYDREMKPVKKNIFCSGLTHTQDGHLFVAGGHIVEHHGNGDGTFRYDANGPDGGWKTLGKLQVGRWYPTITQLPDGRMLISGGSWRSMIEPDAYWNAINNNYEIVDPDTGELIGELEELIDLDAIKKQVGESAMLATYPGVYVLPGYEDDETVVAVVETNRAWLYDYKTGAALERGEKFYPMKTTGSRSYPHYGPMVLLPLELDTKKARILALGGQHESTPLAEHRLRKPYQATTATAEVLDVDAELPLETQAGWRTVGALNQARCLSDATLLADGNVLVSGGSRSGWGDENKGWIYDSELFDSDSETFSPAATAGTDRRYHSIALLLPDGSVLKAGSTGGFGVTAAQAKKWFRARTDAERYRPPYFWRGPRPLIDTVKADQVAGVGTTIRYGKEFRVALTAIAGMDPKPMRAALIRFGAMTHGNNMDQRYVWLELNYMSANSGKWYFTAKAPAHRAAAPPGDYLLVVVEEFGVPSEGKVVRVAEPH